MIIDNEKTVNINGEDYWTVAQFAKLTQRSTTTIRTLVTQGNKLRKLKSIHLENKIFILAEELFNYLFTTHGRSKMGVEFIEKFYLENGELLREEDAIPIEEIEFE